jgi:hypothetical protein
MVCALLSSLPIRCECFKTAMHNQYLPLIFGLQAAEMAMYVVETVRLLSRVEDGKECGWVVGH